MRQLGSWWMLACAALLAGCSRQDGSAQAAGAASSSAHAGGEAPPGELRVDPSLLASGRVVIGKGTRTSEGKASLAAEVVAAADGEAEASTLVSGRIGSLLASEGDRVERGQVLAWIDAPDAARASADAARASARLAVASRKLARQTELLEQQATSQNAVDEARAEESAARAELAAARSLFMGLGGEAGGPVGSRVPVKAPIAGVIVERRAVLGAPVSPDRSLFRIVAADKVIAIGQLAETAGEPPAAGTPVLIAPRASAVRSAAAGMSPCEGKVEGSSALLDAVTRTFPVRVKPIAVCPWLRPGAFAEIRLTTDVTASAGSADKLFVPREATIEVHGAATVFVAKGNEGRFEVRGVRVGEPVGEMVPIEEGLKAEEQIAVRGALLLKGELLRGELGGD